MTAGNRYICDVSCSTARGSYGRAARAKGYFVKSQSSCFNCKTIRALLLRKMWKSTSSFVAVFRLLFLIVICEGKASICSGNCFSRKFSWFA